MTFENPYYLLLILAAPAVVWLRRRSDSQPALRFSSLAGAAELPVSMRVRLRWIPSALRIAALVLVAIAFARPRTGLEITQVTTKGVDIVLAVDISGSMRADDLEPGRSRLDLVKEVADSFVAGRAHDRIGLVVFARHAFRQVPLTLDRDVVRWMLGRVEIGLIDQDRTAIGSALATAINALKNSRAKSKVVVLLTDGVNNFGRLDPVTAAGIAADLDIKVYTIGAGADRVVRTFFTRRVKKAEIDEKTLQEIAEKTGGLYFRARDRQSLQAIYERIDQLEQTVIEKQRYTRYREHVAWLVLPALGLLLAELALAGTLLRTSP